MAKITAPAGKAAAGLDAPGGNRFDDDGSFTTDDEAVVAYCRSVGYGVGGSRPTPVEVPEAPDPRKLDNGGITPVGTPLRDAAVDPHKTDFLPPTNAGKANPHGPLVVAPGIHAVETQVVRPGPVHVEDLAAQQKAETDQATKLLVEGQDVGEALPAFDPDGERGPLGLSDPGSVQATGTGNTADQEKPTSPDGSADVMAADPADLKGAALDQALDDAGLSKTGNADEKRARLAEHRGA